jgi:hypothetical protein
VKVANAYYWDKMCNFVPFSQLTRIPVNDRLTYNENVEDEFLPARFHNIGELEFQHNLGRFWYAKFASCLERKKIGVGMSVNHV